MVHSDLSTRRPEVAETAARPVALPERPVAEPAPKAPAADVVAVHDGAAAALAAVVAAPDVRGDLVARIQARIASGTYPIDAKAVAAALIALAEKRAR
jgi:flagellar biosynthesis anti-sigma factor FlgM